MPKLGALLDARYQAVGAEACRMTPTRLVLAAALTALAGLGVGWPQALAWGAAVFASETWTFLATRRMTGGPAGRSSLWNYFWCTNFGVPVWSLFGLILWTGPSEACRFAAAAYWCGQLLYAQNFCVKSPLSVIQIGIPSVAAPLLIPLVLPHFHGTDQVLVMLMVALCAGHAVTAALDNMSSARKLAAATQALVAGKRAAEAARAEMAAAKAEAEAANQAKSSFLATMSHEIRTPLNGVLGMAQAMAAGDLPGEQRERLGVIRQSGETLLTLLNDVLDLAKIEAGRLELEVIDFELSEVVCGAVSTFASVAQAKGLAFGIDIEAARGRYRGDPNRVRQILHNLVSNGLKFTEAGEVRVTALHGRAGLTIQVRDTGVGMDAQGLARLFQPFDQGDASMTRRYGGTGLGLSICRQLAELMGGEISATSQPGAGAVFTVRLPLARLGDEQAASDGPPPAQAQDQPDRALRVLAAEDNTVNQLVLKTLLAQAGVEPVVVEDGAQAVEAWRGGGWDLILMDVQMPVMDGLTAARTIRQLEAASGARRTPILALTADVMAHQVAEYDAAGIDGHVGKPIKAQDLFAAIQAVLEPAADPSEAAA
jgi:signal transduction histidine kinase/ActR/RegA family two-component response regulator